MQFDQLLLTAKYVDDVTLRVRGHEGFAFATVLRAYDFFS